ncbi:MAG: hypothetical protein ABW217_21860 [Polyangiaceae bacterium]
MAYRASGSPPVHRLTRTQTALAWIRRYWPVVAYWLLGSALVIWIGREAFSTRLITQLQGSDYWEHSAALRALIEAPLHPGNPHLVSDTLSPRYNPVYILIALVTRALGEDALYAMSLASCVNMTLYVAGGYWFFASYFRDRRAPLYALFVLFASWWTGWHFSNVYQLQTLPSVAGYPSTTTLALTWLCFALVTSIVRSGASTWRLALLSLLSATVLLVHPLTAVLTFCGMTGLAVFEPGASRRVRVYVVLALLVSALLAHLWPYYSAFKVMSGGSHGRTAGWAEKAARDLMDDAPAPTRHALFYNTRKLVGAVGLAAPGLVCALLLLWRRKHLFIPLGLSCMLGVFAANAFVPLPLGHRFVLLAMVFLHLATVWGCLRISPGYHDASPLLRWRAVRWLAVVILIGAFTLGAVRNVGLAVNRVDEARGISQVVNYSRQVSKAAGEHGVVLGAARDAWPIPTFGPKVVSLLHMNPLVQDGLQREDDVTTFFGRRTSPEARDAILAKYSVTHVLSRNEPKALRTYLEARASARRIAMGYRLYTLKGASDAAQ